MTLTREVNALTMLVTKDADAKYGSTEVYAYFETLEDAIVSALAMVEARGLVIYKHQRAEFTVAGAEVAQAHFAAAGFNSPRSVSAMTFLPETDEDGTVTEWADSGKHVGAIYASELSAPAVIAR